MQVVIDFETNYPINDTITSMWLQWSATDRCLIEGADIQIALKALADNTTITDYIFHNAGYDLGFTTPYFRDKVYGRVRDTMIMSRARGEIVSNLKHLGAYYTARPGNYAWHIPGTKHSFDDPAYGCEDVDVTWQLFKRWEKELDKPVVELMNRAVVMFSCQTAVGTTINLQALDTLAIDGKKLEQDLKAGLIEKYGCDPGQTDTLASRLRTMGYPLNRQTKTGKDALTKEALNELGLDDIVEWRQAQKLDSSFVGKIKSLIRSDGRLPHHQKVMEAKTGRTSMSDFNWQQAGRKGPTKGLLISQFPGGIIGSVDLAQAELRVACLLSGDLDMMEWLLMTDAHRFNAAMAFGVKFEDVTDEQRTDAKTVVFRLIYGGSAITDGQKIVEKYLRSRFKKFFQWFERTRKEAMSECEITDYFGKTCGLAQILDWRGKWAVGRAGVNSPIQGLASHIAIHITVKIWELFREYGLQSLVLFGVHDSIVMDIHPEEKDIVVSIVKQAFRSVMDTLIGQLALAKRLPISGELQFGSSWADTKNGDKILCSSLEVV